MLTLQEMLILAAVATLPGVVAGFMAGVRKTPSWRAPEVAGALVLASIASSAGAFAILLLVSVTWTICELVSR